MVFAKADCTSSLLIGGNPYIRKKFRRTLFRYPRAPPRRLGSRCKPKAYVLGLTDGMSPRSVWVGAFDTPYQGFYQLSDPSSGMTAFMPVMATSIISSSGSNTVKRWIISPGARSVRETMPSDRPANRLNS